MRLRVRANLYPNLRRIGFGLFCVSTVRPPCQHWNFKAGAQLHIIAAELLKVALKVVVLRQQRILRHQG